MGFAISDSTYSITNMAARDTQHSHFHLFVRDCLNYGYKFADVSYSESCSL